MLLLLVLFGWLGRWEGLVLLGWLASGALMCTRAGERFTVVAGCGFRRPSHGHAAALEPALTAALARAGLDRGQVDLYVQRSSEMNAYATGARSVAVTSGMLNAVRARRLTSDEIAAVVLHDLLTAPLTAMPEIPAAWNSVSGAEDAPGRPAQARGRPD